MIPALLKRTSRRPQRCQAASSIASMSAPRVTVGPHGVLAQLGGELLGGASIQVRDEDAGAVGCQSPRARSPDSTGAARDQHGASGQCLVCHAGIMAPRPRRKSPEDTVISPSKCPRGEVRRPPSHCGTTSVRVARMLRTTSDMMTAMRMVLGGLLVVLLFMTGSAFAQQIEIKAPTPERPRQPLVVPPGDHFQMTRPSDADNYPSPPLVNYDPAFIEPLSKKIETPTSTGRL